MLHCGQAGVRIWSTRDSFIKKSHQHVGIKRLSFFVVAGLTAMYIFYMKMKCPCPSTLSRAPPPDG